MQEQAILFEQKVTNGLVLDSDVLLDALSDAPPQYSLIVQLALLIGARRGEICALRWSDIDLEKGTISINRTVQFIPGTGLVFNPPKTKRSRRCIRIGSDCVELLREYQRYQKAERFRIGSAWVRKVTLENGKVVDNDMLFTKWDGEPMDPDIISTWFPKFLTEHGLPQVHFHSLRHTNASILIAAHTPITTVSGRLGHAQTSTTLNITMRRPSRVLMQLLQILWKVSSRFGKGNRPKGLRVSLRKSALSNSRKVMHHGLSKKPFWEITTMI